MTVPIIEGTTQKVVFTKIAGGEHQYEFWPRQMPKRRDYSRHALIASIIISALILWVVA